MAYNDHKFSFNDEFIPYYPKEYREPIPFYYPFAKLQRWADGKLPEPEVMEQTKQQLRDPYARRDDVMRNLKIYLMGRDIYKDPYQYYKEYEEGKHHPKTWPKVVKWGSLAGILAGLAYGGYKLGAPQRVWNLMKQGGTKLASWFASDPNAAEKMINTTTTTGKTVAETVAEQAASGVAGEAASEALKQGGESIVKNGLKKGAAETTASLGVSWGVGKLLNNGKEVSDPTKADVMIPSRMIDPNGISLPEDKYNTEALQKKIESIMDKGDFKYYVTKPGNKMDESAFKMSILPFYENTPIPNYKRNNKVLYGNTDGSIYWKNPNPNPIPKPTPKPVNLTGSIKFNRFVDPTGKIKDLTRDQYNQLNNIYPKLASIERGVLSPESITKQESDLLCNIAGFCSGVDKMSSQDKKVFYKALKNDPIKVHKLISVLFGILPALDTGAVALATGGVSIPLTLGALAAGATAGVGSNYLFKKFEGKGLKRKSKTVKLYGGKRRKCSK